VVVQTRTIISDWFNEGCQVDHTNTTCRASLIMIKKTWLN